MVRKQNEKESAIPFWIVPIACLIFGISAALVVYKIPPILTLIISDFHTDAFTASFLMSAITFVGFLLAIPTGFLERKLGAKTLVAISACCCIVGCSISAISLLFESAAMTVLIIARCIEGVCYIFASICVPLLICRSVPKNRIGISTCIWGVWVSVGGIISSSLTPSLYQGLGWTPTMFIYAFIVAIASAIMFAVLKICSNKANNPESSEDENSTSKTKEVSAQKNSNQDVLRNIVIWMISWLLLSVLVAAVSNYTPTALKMHANLDNVLAGQIASLPMFIAIFSSLIFGAVADKQKTYKFVYTLGILLMIPAIVLIFTNVADLMLLGIILAGIGLGAPSVTALAVVQLLPTKWHGIGMGVGMAVCCLGQSAGNMVIQLLLNNDFSNWIGTAVFLAIIGIASLILSCLVKVKR